MINFFLFTIKKIGPAWILHTLAALYWRGQGRASNGIECFRQALSTVPDQHRHIPLTNLAALLLKMGQVKDALKLAAEAHRVDGIEPTTNYLTGLLYMLEGNHSIAFRHFQRSLKVEPLPEPLKVIEQYKLVAACHAIEKDAAQQLQCQGVV